MRNRLRYLPVTEAQAGMVLHSAANSVRGGQVMFSLPEGHTLTDENVHQLLSHRVEFIYISEPDSRSDEQVANDSARVAGRVLQIFDGADLTDITTAQLFEQILAYRNA